MRLNAIRLDEMRWDEIGPYMRSVQIQLDKFGCNKIHGCTKFGVWCPGPKAHIELAGTF